MIDENFRHQLYVKVINSSIKQYVPFSLRANLTSEELDELKERNWNRCIAALAMERVLVEVFNGNVDLEKIEIVLNNWRATL